MIIGAAEHIFYSLSINQHKCYFQEYSRNKRWWVWSWVKYQLTVPPSVNQANTDLLHTLTLILGKNP